MTHPITLHELSRVFAHIGFLSFGGPAAQIALMHRVLVQDRNWLSEPVFLRALSLCMLLPGPEAMQLATYAGWRLRGTLGGMIAGLLFVLPGAILITILALAYAVFGAVPWVEAAFLGIKAAVIVIVLQALYRLRVKALSTPVTWVLATTAFLGLFLANIPYPAIIAGAAVIGALLLKPRTEGISTEASVATNPMRVVAVWGTLWLTPILVLSAMNVTFLTEVALFFSKLAVVSFGGAYAVLAYMTQTVVVDFNWITTDQMLDALGLAETTPGPLILVTQFVAMLAGFAERGIGLALAAGAITLWVTFVPCFLWIFLAAPYLEAIAGRPRLSGALQGITAAVVGVIFNLILWFAIHVLFHDTQQVSWSATPLPLSSAPHWTALGLFGLAAGIVLYFKHGMGQTLAIMAVSGLLTSQVGTL